MPLLRSRHAVRRARWSFLRVFFLSMGLLAILFAALLVGRVVWE